MKNILFFFTILLVIVLLLFISLKYRHESFKNKNEVTFAIHAVFIAKENILFLEEWMKNKPDCELLNLITHDTTMLDQVFEGYMFDKIIRNDGLYQYIVYLPELKMISRITSRVDKNNYEKANFKLYLFKQEERLKQKIRLQLYT